MALAQQTVAVTPGWGATPHFTAAGNTDIRVINAAAKELGTIYLAISADDTPPTQAPTLCSPVDSKPDNFQIPDTGRLWIAAPHSQAGGDVILWTNS